MEIGSQVRPDTAAILNGLKDFQRATVEHVFRRLYLDPDSTRRFLVADEVGLGKTLVARGVIAKAIDHLWDKIPRIDIVYVCSNTDIARQNINRLNVTGCNGFSLASRITLLPISLQKMNPRLNFISFTPGTSFDLRSSAGLARERALLYWMLKDAWSLTASIHSRPFEVTSKREGFQWELDYVRNQCEIHPGMSAGFVDAVRQRPELRREFDRLLEEMPPRRDIPDELRSQCGRWISDLRRLLAETCLHWLEPDLIILDEFQRFKHLLQQDADQQSEAAQLAEFLFNFQQPDGDSDTAARVLLLSATPYKMYTQRQETEQDDHYSDFQATLNFLFQEPGQQEIFRNRLQRYREELFRLTDHGIAGLVNVKTELETLLRRVMARTEKLALKSDRNGMLEVIPAELSLTPAELRHYLGLQRVARHLGHDDVLEYWKSAPYLLNFMDGYNFKRKFEQATNKESPEFQPDSLLVRKVRSLGSGLLDREQLERYRRLDPANARLRTLHRDTIGCEAWRLLWIAPSFLYYAGMGPYAEPGLQKFTKRLVFSCWKVVPKAIASVLSYEAERSMTRRSSKRSYTSKRRSGLLQFRSRNGHPTGMPILNLVYPFWFLAEQFDPLKYLKNLPEGTPLPTQEDILEQIRSDLNEFLLPVVTEYSHPGDGADENWYWAAPILLDLTHQESVTREWLARSDLATAWRRGTHADSPDSATGWLQHVKQVQKLVAGQLKLGKPPENLGRVLAQLALAAPGVASLRAIQRILPPGDRADSNVLFASAGQLAHAFLHLFNLPEVIDMLRDRTKETPYWQSALNYCVAGNLQSVLDEYAHLLLESQGLADKAPNEIASEISTSIAQALTLNTATAKADIITANGRQARMRKEDEIRIRNRFAMRFGDQEKDDSTMEQTRADHVRAAFNSPFWPFVLATTSIGQEGLDFHPYCHAVVHWNLPSNPVDLEQREGRVHRYKGHALRKNIASAFGEAARNGNPDPWNAMFKRAGETRSNGENDLFPFWLAPQGEAKIQRHVPAFPHSRDRIQQVNLSRSLVLYRMVFGQNRQEDLVEYLLSKQTPEDVERIVDQCRVDLSPPVWSPLQS